MRNKILRWILGPHYQSIINYIQNRERDEMMSPQHDSGLNDKYLFDFARDYHGGNFIVNGGTNFGGINLPDTVEPELVAGEGGISEIKLKKVEKPQKIALTPVDALKELEMIPTPFTILLLDEKISMLKDKAELLRQHYAKRDVLALIERLENRKKYAENKDFFDKFQNTNDENIEKLLKKYKLVMKESDIFIPEFPDDAVNIMKEYTAKVEAMCGKKPVYHVIAEEKDFQKKYEKRDPILLAQSPFGFYWQVLGAWDKEMILLGEL